MQLTYKQEEGLKTVLAKYKAHQKYAVIAGYAGAGKAQPVDTIIPTPNGKRKLGDLKVGDYVFDRYGKPTKILGVYPQGEKSIYKVVLSDGRESLCADDHLWSYYSSKNNLISKTAKEMLLSGVKNSCGYKYKIPNNYPAEYEEKPLSVDPYMLGVFIGNGCCKEKYLTLSSENIEIPSYIGKIIDATPIKNSENNYSWTFVWNSQVKEISWISNNNAHRVATRAKPKTEDYFNIYKENIMTLATEKSIPEEYKYGSINQRIALLQGLFDTDGSISSNDEHRYNIRYTSASLRLIKDVQEILFGLGYSSTIHEDKREEQYTNGVCYNLSVNIPNEEKYKLFRLKRKYNIAIEAQKYHKRKDYDKISIINIVPIEEKTQMVCIYVDNDEHLYLTNDYIVTHNTTLVNFIVKALDIPPEKIAFATFTGKAAEVLRKKGNPNAITLHKLLYESVPRKDGTFYRREKQFLPYKLVIVDEVSMAPKSMVQLLLRKVPFVIFLGDPFQLPPVSKDDTHDLLDYPDVFLDEIMRQAQESEIIRLSMDIRNGKKIKPFKGKEVQIYNRDELNTGMLTWADQILCATNNTRHTINQQVRQILGYSGELQENEKCIFKRNYWDYCNKDGDALVNGSIGYVRNITDSYLQINRKFTSSGRDITVPLFIVDFQPDGCSTFEHIDIDKNFLLKEEPGVDWKTSYKMGRRKDAPALPLQATYGYCLTTHAAQGSEWDNVLVIEERFPFDEEEHARWLYTAVTRAAHRLVLIR